MCSQKDPYNLIVEIVYLVQLALTGILTYLLHFWVIYYPLVLLSNTGSWLCVSYYNNCWNTKMNKSFCSLFQYSQYKGRERLSYEWLRLRNKHKVLENLGNNSLKRSHLLSFSKKHVNFSSQRK